MVSESRRAGVRPATATKVAILLVLLGASLAFAGVRVGGPFVGGAVAAFGAAATLAGVHGMRTRRDRAGGQSSDPIREHSGAAAFLFGVTFLVPGLIMLVAGAASAAGMSNGLWPWLLDRPGPVAILAGLWVVMAGLGMVVSRWKYTNAPAASWLRMPGHLLGLLTIAVGAGMVMIGRQFMLDPEHPREVTQRVAAWIARLLSGGAG